MCAVLNPIIETGGTTAHRTPFSPDRMVAHYITSPKIISTFVAIADGDVVGFQYLGMPDPSKEETSLLPAKCAIIASFVGQGQQGKGIGHKLFVATKTAAITAGYDAIDATIRHENQIGQGFYEKLGFRDYRKSETAISKVFHLT